MRKYFSIFALLIASSTVQSAASGTQRVAGALTPIQKEQVSKIVEQYEKSCLAGPPLPANASKPLKIMTAWSTDPAICSCTGERLRAAFTPKVFTFTKEQYAQFQLQFAENGAAECGVPVMKAHINESCEQFLGAAIDEMSEEQKAKRLSELGYKNADLMVKASCTCVRDKIRDITPHQWAVSSMTHYREYLNRKQTGMASSGSPQTPLDEAMGACFKR
jgi:hypothetical protein